MSAVVRTAIEAGVVRIVLTRPEAGNAVTPALIAALAEAVALAERPETGAVLIEGEGRNFCVGADLRHFQRSTEPLPRQLDAMAVDFHAMLLRLATLPVPVVAAVQGHAVGGGLGLMLAADVVFAGQSARFSTGYAKLGLSADAGVSYFLTRALGPRRARSLLMTARAIDAAQAERWGLVDMLVGDDALAGAALDTARALAAGPTAAFGAMKRLVAAAEAGAGLSEHLDAERTAIVDLAGDAFATAAIARMLRP